MRLKISETVSARADDQEIVAALDKKSGRSLGGKNMVIGIRNEAGTIYRLVTTEGLPQFLAAIDVMQSLGFTDELENAAGMKHGCDAIFSKH